MTADEQARWHQLLDQAATLRRTAPWRELYEDQCFCFSERPGGDVVLVSVMGRDGEHLAVALYLGLGAVYRFLNLTRQISLRATDLLEAEQLQLSFEDRDELRPEEYELLRSLGRGKYRGMQAWPVVRRMRPATYPVLPTDAEVALLLTALALLPRAAAQWQDPARGPELQAAAERNHFLLYTPTAAAAGSRDWQETVAPLPPEPVQHIAGGVPPELLAACQGLPRTRDIWICDLSIYPTPIRESQDPHPYFAYLFHVTHHASGRVLGFELLRPQPDWHEPYRQFAAAVLRTCSHVGKVPNTIRVSGQPTALALAAAATPLHIRVEVDPEEAAASEELAVSIALRMG